MSCLSAVLSPTVIPFWKSAPPPSRPSLISFFIKLVIGSHCPSTSHSHVSMQIKGFRQKKTPSPLSQRKCHLWPFQPLHPFSMFGLLIPYGRSNATILPAVLTIHTSHSLIFTLQRGKTNQLGASFLVYIFHLDSYLKPCEPVTKYISSRYATKALPHDPLGHHRTGRMATRF